MARRIAIIGAHASHGASMRRYTQLLVDAYQSLGVEYELLEPTDRLSRRSPRRFVKWVAYVEKFIIFPVRLLRIPRGTTVHVADHSDSLYLWFVSRHSRSVVTCHDLLAVEAAFGWIPEHRPRLTGRLYQRLVVASLRRAGLLIAVSATTAGAIKAIAPSNVVKIVFNPLAPTIDELASASDPSTTTRGNYALVVSSSGWRKRREAAVEVWAKLRAADTGLRLVVVGPTLNATESAVFASDPTLETFVTTVQGISDAELSKLYSEARFLLQMSKYEGFCWPIIEANAFGTTAVCADEPILRETGVGNVFVPSDGGPFDSRKVLREAQDDARRASLRERALAFTVERFAKEIDAAVLSPSIAHTSMERI